MNIPNMLTENSKAPEFTLPDQNGTTHSLSEYRGKWVLLYFYPKDMTPGCTVEACSLRDASPDFSKLGATVLGVSKDSVKSHKKFEEKHGLNFTLLSDEEGKMLADYEAIGKKKFMGREFTGVYRISYLIDPEGKIAKAYESVKPAAHAEQVKADIEALSK